MNNKLAGMAFVAFTLCSTSSQAAVVHFQTTSTTGTFTQVFDPIPDTSAFFYFYFDIDPVGSGQAVINNGFFSDANLDSVGAPVFTYELSSFGPISLTSQSNLYDGLPNDVLTITFDASSLSTTTARRSYYFVGGTGAQAEGSFTGTLSAALTTVPLPASASMFGAALLGFGAVGYGVKRKKAAAAA